LCGQENIWMLIETTEESGRKVANVTAFQKTD
jgi:hypothetical protein